MLCLKLPKSRLFRLKREVLALWIKGEKGLCSAQKAVCCSTASSENWKPLRSSQLSKLAFGLLWTRYRWVPVCPNMDIPNYPGIRSPVEITPHLFFELTGTHLCWCARIRGRHFLLLVWTSPHLLMAVSESSWDSSSTKRKLQRKVTRNVTSLWTPIQCVECVELASPPMSLAEISGLRCVWVCVAIYIWCLNCMMSSESYHLTTSQSKKHKTQVMSRRFLKQLRLGVHKSRAKIWQGIRIYMPGILNTCVSKMAAKHNGLKKPAEKRAISSLPTQAGKTWHILWVEKSTWHGLTEHISLSHVQLKNG